MVVKDFIVSEFGCSTLAELFNSRKLNNRIEKFYERALRIVVGLYIYKNQQDTTRIYILSLALK